MAKQHDLPAGDALTNMGDVRGSAMYDRAIAPVEEERNPEAERQFREILRRHKEMMRKQ